jgi:hypothetical protein
MKAGTIPLSEIIKRIASRRAWGHIEGGDWCHDSDLYRITGEEFMNLQALASRKLEATDAELDQVSEFNKTVDPIGNMHIRK